MSLDAVLAWAGHEAGADVCLVCELQPTGMTLTLVTGRSGVRTVIASRDLPHDDELLRTPGVIGSPALTRARTDERHLDSAVRRNEHGTLTAAEVLTALRSDAERLRAAAAEMINGRSPDPIVVLTGPLTAVPEIEAMAASGGLFSRVVIDGVRGTEVTARGSELLDTGEVTIGPSYPHALALRAHGVRGGVLQDVPFEIAAAGRVDGTGSDVDAAGPIDVVEDSQVVLGVLAPDFEAVAPLPGVAAPAPGRYRVGVRLVDGFAELVFRPDSGGEPVVRRVGPLPVRHGAS